MYFPQITTFTDRPDTTIDVYQQEQQYTVFSKVYF